MVLVDSSVWIEVFRRHEPLDLADHLERNEMVTCLPVIQEVLQGFRTDAALRLAKVTMLALPRAEDPLGLDLYLEAIALYRTARRAGRTIRSATDCVIAVCALRNDLAVLHRDRDYEALASVSGLRTERI